MSSLLQKNVFFCKIYLIAQPNCILIIVQEANENLGFLGAGTNPLLYCSVGKILLGCPSF